ncbi:TPA: phage tail protein [Citrobacter amalonaticus]|nr:phage tail protein [Citrobacter amalonaticus]HEM6739752.1 phage tail protein [Citrobacter amalonaticus]HEM7848633.1 phage tail protein [Citrobacter amalonaticus]HEM7923133.1 phage tail protein [Citrobacter amalonaticus]
MMKYLWSVKNNAFFPVALKKNYIAAGWDLSDTTPINDEIAAEFMSNPPTGKIRGASSDGMPVWLDIESEPASSEVTPLQET